MKADYIFVLPGTSASRKQELMVQKAMYDLGNDGKRCAIVSTSSPNIYYTRNGCIKNIMCGARRDQKPFEGIYENYDRMIWVDSDNLITAEKIKALIAHDVDICAAWYRMYKEGDISDNNKTACWYSDPTTQTDKPILVKEMVEFRGKEYGLVEVDYAGFGLIVIKKGVFESIEYPWFSSWTLDWTDSEGVECSEIVTDDAGFCIKIKAAGFKIYVDPNVQVLHQKVVDL